MDKVKSFSERLLEALKIRELSAAELSRCTGVSEAVISQYKKGLYVPKDDRLNSFARILKVSVIWLMGYDVPIEPDISNDGVSYLKDSSFASIDSIERGERFRLSREHVNLTVDEVAQATGISASMLRRIENGDGIGDLYTGQFLKFLDLYKITMPYLWGDLNDPSVNADKLRDKVMSIAIVKRLKIGFHRFEYSEISGYCTSRFFSIEEDVFFIAAPDDSMAPQINKDDLALVHYEQSFNSGDCIAILVGDSDSPQIRIYQEKSNCSVYFPINISKYEPIMIMDNENLPVHILGRVLSVASEKRISESKDNPSVNLYGGKK